MCLCKPRNEKKPHTKQNTIKHSYIFSILYIYKKEQKFVHVNQRFKCYNLILYIRAIYYVLFYYYYTNIQLYLNFKYLYVPKSMEATYSAFEKKKNKNKKSYYQLSQSLYTLKIYTIYIKGAPYLDAHSDVVSFMDYDFFLFSPTRKREKENI